MSTKTPKPFSSGLLSILSPPSLFVPGLALVQVQDLVLGLVELHQMNAGCLISLIQEESKGKST